MDQPTWGRQPTKVRTLQVVSPETLVIATQGTFPGTECDLHIKDDTVLVNSTTHQCRVLRAQRALLARSWNVWTGIQATHARVRNRIYTQHRAGFRAVPVLGPCAARAEWTVGTAIACYPVVGRLRCDDIQVEPASSCASSTIGDTLSSGSLRESSPATNQA